VRVISRDLGDFGVSVGRPTVLGLVTSACACISPCLPLFLKAKFKSDHKSQRQVDPEMDLEELIRGNLKIYNEVKPKNPPPSYTVIATLNDADSKQLLALATGTQASVGAYPDDIEDCHAESLIKRAFKRYILDRLLSEPDGESLRLSLRRLNELRLVLFISQFPCGLVRRYQGDEPVDETTGAEIDKKPGRGQERDGKIVFVQRSKCMNKLKRWISGSGLQGRRFHQELELSCKLARIVIGQCESDPDLEYEKNLADFYEKLALREHNIDLNHIPIREEEFVFDVDSKKPQDVSLVWWHSDTNGQNANRGAKGRYEYIVNGRRIGLTKSQCDPSRHNERHKLKIGDHWLRKDLARLKERFQSG